MKISVVIPVYNVARYLTRCLDSVVASARAAHEKGHEVEVICVDDGSTDESPAILADYRARLTPDAPSFLVVTKENGGLGSARNAGLDRMSGDFVTFVDSDDYILPWTLAAFASVAEASGASLVVSSSFLKDRGSLRVPAVAPSGAFRYAMRPRAWIAGKKVQYSAWNKFYRRDVWASRRYPATIFEDFPTTTGVFCDLESFAVVREPLYVYCVNPGASTLVHSPFGERKLRDSLANVRAIVRYAQGTDAFRFAVRQAADGLGSTVSKVFKTRNSALGLELVQAVARLKEEAPDVVRALSLKARIRLGLMRLADRGC